MARDLKEQWARLRRGNIGKVGKKRIENEECGLCTVEEENLQHIWNYVEARKEVKKKRIDGKEEEVSRNTESRNSCGAL